MKKCPNCGFENNATAKFCEHCGQPLAENPVTDPAGISDERPTTLAANAQPADTNASKDLKAESATKFSTEPATEPTTPYRFCPNCGAPVEAGMIFCANCGYDLRQEATKTEGSKQTPASDKRAGSPPVAPSQRLKTTPPRPARAPLSQKQKLGLGIGAAVLLLAGGAYAFGRHYYSYDSQVARLAEAFKAQDPAELAKVVTSEDPNYTVTEKGLAKFVAHYKAPENKKAFADLLATVKQRPQELADFELKPSGKKFGLFENYQLVIKPVYLEVTTKQPATKLVLDGKAMSTSKGSHYKATWGPLTPGDYQVDGTLADEKSDTKVSLVRFKNPDFETDSHVKIDLHKISFLAKSNVEGAEVVLDGKKVATIQNGEAEVRDQVWHQGLKAQAQKTAENGTLKSDGLTIGESDFLAADYDASNHNSELNLDFPNVQTKSDVQYFLDDVYAELTDYTDSDYSFGAAQKSKLAKYFVNGVNNVDEQDFEKFINDVRSSKIKSHVNGKAEVESVTLTGKDTYVAQYLIYYDTVYRDSRPDVNQTFRYKKATLHFDENENQFQINDLGGAENFETVDGG